MDDQTYADRYESIANRLWSGDLAPISYLNEILCDAYDVIRAEGLDYIIEAGEINQYKSLVFAIKTGDPSNLVNNRLRIVYAIYGIYDKMFKQISPLVTDEDIAWHYAARFIESHVEVYRNIVVALGETNDMRVKSLSLNLLKWMS